MEAQPRVSRHPLLHPLVLFVAVGLGLGVVFFFTGLDLQLAITAYLVVGVTLLVTMVDMFQALRAGHWGLDILAVVAMIATLVVEEYLAGMIIALMLTGGEALEAMAAGRASRELDSLINRRPTFAYLLEADGVTVTRVALDEVQVGDLLVVRGSEVVPVDGHLISDRASLDESSVTGEALPVTKHPGDEIISGTVNGSETFQMRATTTAADSQYAKIVQLVEEAVQSRAPMVRLADRYAVPFTVIALLVAAVAWWYSGDPVRFAEVLVVATPCPLLIGAPVAFMGGMSSAAQANVIVKDGGTLERLARIESAAFDKTGTLTQGRPTVGRITPVHGTVRKTLQLAASAEQYSVHVFAGPIIEHAHQHGVELISIDQAQEVATNGVEATTHSGERLRVGKSAFIAEVVKPFEDLELTAGETAVYVSCNDQLVGIIVLTDPLRATTTATIEWLADQGVDQMVMVTGDMDSTAQAIAKEIGFAPDQVHSSMTPTDKVQVVQAMPSPTLMVGDGINDAPILAAADIGIAMGARGSTAASESADAVITSERFARLADVTHIAKRTVSIALQSIWFGMAVSIGLMAIAAFGYLPATFGALMQEVVDIVAIVIALRALRLHRHLPSDRLGKSSRRPSPTHAPSSSR
ncbi:heavy metal translocating P-type ATPase [Enteractinococcus coprophilus]|uniref:P-type E1-E2 ATPase/heavy metal translocating P-type ATPase n=1 Tax=Enteractinococcus coprophilus TaxID=1027633 RepID=A0A543AG60_9MICC|nr:heavy metal translocating P-type ATPase [Enteractinococcus coprophilus]TQL71506.1 P-type E1-E2 ATPase/heavy metal translocating P-type ATPase [Enteractinococcus coprophilus]